MPSKSFALSAFALFIDTLASDEFDSFEESGKHADRDLIQYAKALKAEGMPFQGNNAGAYESLKAADFRRIARGELKRAAAAAGEARPLLRQQEA
jgi:hypothetical protein